MLARINDEGADLPVADELLVPPHLVFLPEHACDIGNGKPSGCVFKDLLDFVE